MKINRLPQSYRMMPSLRTLLLGGAMLLPMIAGGAFADDTGAVTKEDLKLLQQELEAQKQMLEQQKQALQQQQSLISNQQNQLNFLKSQVGASDDPDTTPVTFNLGNGTFTTGNSESGVTKTQDSTDQPVGEAPPAGESDGIETKVATVVEGGGVLSDRGELVVEPSLRFTHSTSNRAFATGVEIQDIVFIGLIEVDEADRDSIESALTLRYGITDRFEVETRVPFVYRSEDITQSFVTQTGQPQFSDSNTGTGLGDIEVAAHYQITDAPIYTVANVRLYTPTGEGPFDVDVDGLGRQTELATGSGFWGVQPSITAIMPSDPVVFFGTFGYTINIPEDIDDTFTIFPTPTSLSIVSTIGEVDPGDSINVSLGMGLSLNEQFSFSLGFKYDYIFPTTEEVVTTDNNTGTTVSDTVETDPLHAASFLAGWAYQINETVGVTANFEVGATDDANDFSVRIGVPFRFKNLFGVGE
jgi:hypothetical protein